MLWGKSGSLYEKNKTGFPLNIITKEQYDENYQYKCER